MLFLETWHDSAVIEAGTALGPYEIIAPAGAGGMGEVYKARDTRLDRLVAIKVLPPHLSDNPENRERFEREARAISGLNHPHICTLHDIGRQGDIDFLVMEYLEGETLAARLAAGPLPFGQALALAVQIADALDRAHRQGIVHRDLKPANVMLVGTSGARSGSSHPSRQGPVQAKLLDFGLAKLSAAPQAAGVVSMLPTAMPSAELTARGTILGTLQYMAPEQLEGAEADARTDIFAFGALVYEMVTGQKAFHGKSQASLISAVMSADAPSISAVQSMTPPALDHLVRTCLAKDPSDRWQTMHDVRAQLKWIAEGGSQIGGPAPVVAARRTRSRLAIGLLAVAGLLLAAMAVPTFLYFRGSPPSDPVLFTMGTASAPNPTNFAISPDGRAVAFQAQVTSGLTILVRRLDSTVITPIVGSEGGSFPFWSPDSQTIGFVAGTRLKRVAVAGGAALDLGEATGAGTWNQHGVILYGRGGNLYAVPAAGGQPQLVEVDTPPPSQFPEFLPDGNHFLYMAGGPSPGIHVAALDSKSASLVVPERSSAIYVDAGYVLFHRQAALFAQAFSPRALKVSGEAVQIADQVFVSPPGRAAVSASRNGVLAYRGRLGTTGSQQFEWYERSGKPAGRAGKAAGYNENFDLSPDGKQIALSIMDATIGGPKLWVMDWARGVTTPFMFIESGRDVVWSPDGLRLAYVRNDGGGTGFDIFVKQSSGLGTEEKLIGGLAGDWIEDWSKDGRYIVYGTPGNHGQTDIWAVPLSGDRKPFPVVESPFGKDEPHFSFDGKWLAYGSSESGTWQIYVISFPAGDQKRQISDTGGAQPRWNRSGTELYYLRLDGRMMAADITTGTSLDSGIPRVLFETGLSVLPTVDQYAATPDGQRFLILKPISGEVEAPLTFMINWTRLLPH